MGEGTTALTTERLRVVPATVATITAELEAPERLAEALGAALPADWPPEHHDTGTLKLWRGELAMPGSAGWWLHYVVLTDAPRPALVGTVAFKGPPVAGVVEIGYSVVRSWQRHGFATEASRALIEAAWRRGAELVVAHTLPRLEPSIRVLEKLGFEPAESTEPGVLAFELRRGA